MSALADAALAAGWPADRVADFARGVRQQRGAWLLATPDVLALRTGSGALWRELRDETAACVARANAATADLEPYVRPPEPVDSTAQPAADPALAAPTEPAPKGEPSAGPAPMWAAWTDGSGTTMETPAGIGAVITRDGEVVCEVSRAYPRGTNNIAEVAAVGAALRVLADILGRTDVPVVLHSDSAFAIGAVRHGSQWQVRAHAALVRVVDQVRAEVARWPALEFVQVKGHAGVGLNPRADALAGRARKAVVAAQQRAALHPRPKSAEETHARAG